MSKKINDLAMHDKDTGSSEIQIALLTDKIETLSSHIKKFKKDKHSSVGLLRAVNRRKKLLDYLKKNKIDSYKNVLTKLKLWYVLYSNMYESDIDNVSDNVNGLAGISPMIIEADFNMQRFAPSEGFKQWHTETVSDRNSYRQIVWAIYLNTIKEQGGTEFKFQNHRCAAEQGKVVMWPAGWTHFHKSEVAPKETKYIITGWVMYRQTGGSIGMQQGSMNEPPPFIQMG